MGNAQFFLIVRFARNNEKKARLRWFLISNNKNMVFEVFNSFNVMAMARHWIFLIVRFARNNENSWCG